MVNTNAPSAGPVMPCPKVRKAVKGSECPMRQLFLSQPCLKKPSQNPSYHENTIISSHVLLILQIIQGKTNSKILPQSVSQFLQLLCALTVLSPLKSKGWRVRQCMSPLMFRNDKREPKMKRGPGVGAGQKGGHWTITEHGRTD